jgi:broad specificity phosphatase PhoE
LYNRRVLYLTRHGQTDYNLNRRYQSRTDVPLNETGIEQARSLARGLAGTKFARVISSPMNRAVETAAIITGREASEIETDEVLLEAALGDWEARLEADLIAELGDSYFKWQAMGGLFAPPGGESIYSVMARLAEPAEKWIEEARERDILIVAHQGTNVAFLMLVTGRCGKQAAEDFRQKNGQVDIIDANTRKIVRTLVFP